MSVELVVILLVVVVAVAIWVSRRSVPGIKSISAAELETMIKEKGNVKRSFIDVREPHEYSHGHVSGMKNIPLSQLSGRVGEIPKSNQVVVMCHSGGRSMVAVRRLQKAGYDQLMNVSGGMSAWHGKVVK